MHDEAADLTPPSIPAFIPASIPAPKRQWFQLHLSTAFVTMLVAGGILTVFFTPTYDRARNFKMSKMGFPWTAVCKIEQVGNYTSAHVDFLGDRYAVKTGDWIIAYQQLAANIAVILGILCVVAYLLEWPIRRDQDEKERLKLEQRPRKKRPQREEAVSTTKASAGGTVEKP